MNIDIENWNYPRKVEPNIGSRCEKQLIIREHGHHVIQNPSLLLADRLDGLFEYGNFGLVACSFEILQPEFVVDGVLLPIEFKTG